MGVKVAIARRIVSLIYSRNRWIETDGYLALHESLLHSEPSFEVLFAWQGSCLAVQTGATNIEISLSYI